MNLYLLRHIQTIAPQGLCYGQTDVPLIADYAQHHAHIKQQLPQIEHIYSSPQSRCLQLAKDIQTKQKLTIDPRLQELNFGQWENHLFNDIDKTTLQTWTDNYQTQAPPNGESFQQLQQRTQQFWQTIQSNPHDSLIVTHAGVIRALLAIILEIPTNKVFNFKVNHASLHHFKTHSTWSELIYWNRLLL